jgi:molybdopterin-guanine dinucleotide biosynthesis protein A
LSGIIKGCHGKAIRGETKTISIIVQRYIFSYALQCNAPKLAPSQVLPLFASPKQQPVQAAAWPPANGEINMIHRIFCLSTKYYRNGINAFGRSKHFQDKKLGYIILLVRRACLPDKQARQGRYRFRDLEDAKEKPPLPK